MELLNVPKKLLHLFLFQAVDEILRQKLALKEGLYCVQVSTEYII